MKLALRKLTLLILFLSFSIISKADNIIGGEISYTCLGNGDYEINLLLHKACAVGNSFDSATNGAISVYLGDSQVEFARINIPDMNGEFQLFSLNYNVPCLLDPPNKCIDVGRWDLGDAIRLSDQGINLPKSDQPYHLVYQRCCRNGTISNIDNPSSKGITISNTILPEAQPDDNGDCTNSSPFFDKIPPFIICKDEEFTYELFAEDIDGDQLVYELCSPVIGGGPETNPPNGFNGVNPDPDQYPPFDDITFIAPFSALNPMPASPQLTIDPGTGTLFVKPTVEGQFLFAVCVKEFRNGILLSESRLEMQFNVISCIPMIDIQIGGDDLVSSDSVFRFESCSDTAIIFEDQTAYNFIDTYLWEVDTGGTVLFTSTATNPTINFSGQGIYEGIVIINPGTFCSDTAYLEVEIFPMTNPDFSFAYDTCVIAPIQFFDESTTESDSIVAWEWNFGDGQTSAEQNSTHQYDLAGTYPVELTVTDNLGCMATTSDTIPWFPNPIEIFVEPNSTEGCPPFEVSLNTIATPINQDYDINWSFGDGTFEAFLSPNHIYSDPGNYTLQIDVSSPTGCFIEQTFTDFISVASIPQADFTWTEQISDFKPNFLFENQSDGEVNWFWDFSGEGVSFLENPDFVFNDTGFQIVTLIVENEDGCKDTTQQTIEVIFPIRYFLPNVFTPNQDGKNEFYRPIGIFNGIKNYQFTIWNRFGEMVFETSDPNEGWNGKKNNNGRKSPIGVYICKANFLDTRGKEYSFKEFVTLVR